MRGSEWHLLTWPIAPVSIWHTTWHIERVRAVMKSRHGSKRPSRCEDDQRPGLEARCENGYNDRWMSRQGHHRKYQLLAWPLEQASCSFRICSSFALSRSSVFTRARSRSRCSKYIFRIILVLIIIKKSLATSKSKGSPRLHPAVAFHLSWGSLVTRSSTHSDQSTSTSMGQER